MKYDNQDSRINPDAWCTQILGIPAHGSVTLGARDCAAPRGGLYWCTRHDEPGAKWCDLNDWKAPTRRTFHPALCVTKLQPM